VLGFVFINSAVCFGAFGPRRFEAARPLTNSSPVFVPRFSGPRGYAAPQIRRSSIPPLDVPNQETHP
jgi:hypothetical protein